VQLPIAESSPAAASTPVASTSRTTLRILLGLAAFIVILAMVGAVWTVYYWYLTVGYWDLWEAPAYSHYVWLSHGLLLGNLDLPVSDLALQAPVSELMKVIDPYEPANRLRFSVPFDVSYYDGKFYLYFGVVPAIILALIQKFTGFAAVDDSVLVLGGAWVLMAASAVVIWQVWRRYFPHVHAWYPFLVYMLFAFSEGSFMLLEKPAVYQATILCGQAFLFVGLALVMPVITGRSRNWLLLLLAGTCWGLAWGSRLSLLPTVLLLIGIVVLRLLTFRDSRVKTAAMALAIGIMPLVSIVLTGWYNQARFGNWLESGQRYQFTAYNANAERDHLFSLIYLIPNTQMFLTEPVDRLPEFPYVALAPELTLPKTTDLPEYLLTEAPMVGLLVSTPFLYLTLAALAPTRSKRRELGEIFQPGAWPATVFALIVAAIAVVSEVVVASQRYTAIRYRGDFLFLWLLFVYVVVGQLLAVPLKWGWLLRIVVFVLFAVSIAASLALRIYPFVTTPQ
jgi:hypothetical protein